MKNQTVNLIWIFVEVLCVVRSAIASYNVTMHLSGGDVLFSAFTVGVVELSLFAMLLMAGAEIVAPIATIVLIAFSGVLQFCELAIMTGAMDEQSKMIMRYAVSFAPTVLLLFGLVKRLTDPRGQGAVGDALTWVKRLLLPTGKKSQALDTEAQNGWIETRRVKRWRDADGRKRSKALPVGNRRKR